jgi:phosphoglycolate phosphatase
MDGTLIDSSSVIYNTINYVRQNLGLKKLEKTLLLQKVNDPNINPAQFFYNSTHFSKEQTQLFTTYYEKHCTTDTILYDGIYELLTQLSLKYNLCVATNAYTKLAKKILIHLDISKFFSLIVGSDMVKNPKPSPDMIYKCLDYFKTTKKNTILIGDSLKDFHSAKQAGIKAIMVSWGLSPIKNQNLLIANDINELKNYITNLLEINL